VTRAGKGDDRLGKGLLGFDEASFLWQSVVFYGESHYAVLSYENTEEPDLFYGNALMFSIFHVPATIFMRTRHTSIRLHHHML
jgi:hypothetical protein